jgi:hypothetical protein
MFSAAKSAGPSGYNLTNSLRFRASASAYLSRTPASASNQKTWTWSGWVKRGDLASEQMLFSAGNTYINLTTGNLIECNFRPAATSYYMTTTQVFRDPSAWYHIIVVYDSTQATAANRAKMYINGNQVSAFSVSSYTSIPQNQDATVNSATAHNIGRYTGTGNQFDGYLAEVNFIDGSAKTPSDFGETDTTTGVWKPKAYTGTYGTNGFYLKFSDIATTSGSNAGLGKDFSGNGNYWNTNNISVTAGTTYDAMSDVPTLTSATVANYPTLNPLSNGGATISNANLTTTANGATHLITNATFQMPTSGKYYWEITATTLGSTARIATGLLPNGTALTGYPWGNANTYGWYYGDSSNNIYWCSNSAQPFFIAGAVNDVLQICYDADNGTVYAGKNNVFYNSSGSTTGSPSTLTNPTSTGATATNAFFPATSVFTAGAFAINFGQRPFSYTPPTGFVRLNTYNLPTSTIVKGNTVMDATTYTGTGASLSVTNAGAFKPDFVWVKDRAQAQQHLLFDSVRGVHNFLCSNNTSAEGTNSTTLTSFNTNGFGLGTNATSNQSGISFVGWQWQAGQGTNTTNTSGSITSTVSVNATAGFSVVTFNTGSIPSSATIGHGLGVAPSMIILKARSSAIGWQVYHKSLGNTAYLILNTTAAQVTGSTTFWNSTSPTSSVFTLGSAFSTIGDMVAYCWAEIAGFSKFGSYVGNGSTDGVFVYTGFRPAFILIKRTSATEDWFMFDNKRLGYNADNNYLYSDLSNAEGTVDYIDIVSNGFKMRSTSTAVNSGDYIYMAFAENPFKNALAR